MALTKVSGDVLDAGLNIAGVVTATRFDGPMAAGDFSSNVSIGGTLHVAGVSTIASNLTVKGDLTVEGARTEVKTASLEITDKTVGIASLASPSDATADGAGIVVYGATDKSLKWVNSNDRWTFVGGDVSATAYHGGGITVTGTAEAADISLAGTIYHTGDTDNKIEFGTDSIILKTGNSNRLETNNYGVYVASGLPLAFLASSGDTPNIKSGGSNNRDLLFTAGNAERLRITSAGHLQLQGGKIYGEDAASNTFTLQSTSGNSNHSRIEIGASQSSDNGGIHFYTAGSSTATRRMTLKGTNGHLAVGIDNPSRMFEVKDSTGANRIMNIHGTGTSGAYLAFHDANTTDDSKCRVGCVGGNNIALRGDAHYFQNGAGTDRMVIASDGTLLVGASGGTGATKWLFRNDAASGADGCRLTIYNASNNSVNNQARLSLKTAHSETTFSSFNQGEVYITNPHANAYWVTYLGGVDRFRIRSDGRTEIKSNSDCLRLMPTTSGNAVYMEFYDDGNSSRQGFFGFGSNTETTSTMHMHNNRNGHLEFRTNNTVHFRINSNGDLQGTDTSISSLSDSRLKKNVADFVYDLSKFKQFKPKTFEWINTDKHSSGTQRGFLAQDLEGVDAELTGEATLDAELQSSDITTLRTTSPAAPSNEAKTARLGKNDTIYVSVIQQLITKIETLEAKVTALEAA